jgi:uncharacterized protein (DUF427 family)
VPESVWDYPRPPRLEACTRRLQVVLGGVTIAASTRALRVLETSHPPVYYFPREDIVTGVLEPSASPDSVCEWKGEARYLDVTAGGRRVERGAWTYERPWPAFEAIRNAVAFFPALMDVCSVDGEAAQPQEGGFYGGWITKDLIGPFKGGPGTEEW